MSKLTRLLGLLAHNLHDLGIAESIVSLCPERLQWKRTQVAQ